MVPYESHTAIQINRNTLKYLDYLLYIYILDDSSGLPLEPGTQGHIVHCVAVVACSMLFSFVSIVQMFISLNRFPTTLSEVCLLLLGRIIIESDGDGLRVFLLRKNEVNCF